MIDSEIPPLWLPSRPDGPSQRRFRLPTLLRVRLKSEGLPCVLMAAGSDSLLHLIVCDSSGAALARETLPATAPTPVFLPKGAAHLVLTGLEEGSRVRLGYFPVQKVALKLHAFANGAFAGTSPRARWKAAGVAARTLRGALTALIEASPAGQAGDARRYRHYRAKYVGDFKGVTAPTAAPTLSFLTPLRATTLADLARCAKALAAQGDDAWEWIIAVPPERRRAEDAAIAAAAGPRARLIAAPDDSLGAALAAAAEAATGGLASPLDAAGRPTPDAVAMIRAAFARHGDLVLAYTDEERLDAAGLPASGVFKPAFNAHLLEAAPYLGHLVAARRAAALKTGFDPQAGEATLYDFLLRLSLSLPKGAIRHIPRVAYGAPEGAGGAGFSPSAIHDAAGALSRAKGCPVEVTASGRHLRALHGVSAPAPLVSIVVPTRDRAALLRTALFSLIERTSYRAFEIIIVDNGSTEEDTFALFQEVEALWPQTRIVRDDGGFNFPRICNAGVAEAEGSLILLLNNDVEVIDPGWLTEMVALAGLPGAGIVGAKLLFADRSVQHAGVIVGLFRYADHWFAHSAADAPGYQDRLLVRQNLSAVTGACLLVRKDVWDAIGPLDAARFAEDCNDIDLCLRARQAGYDVVFTPFAQLLHYESASRGKKRSKAHRERLKAQRARMEETWHTAHFVDPHFNPNLARKSLYAAVARAPEGGRDPRTDAVSGAPK